MREMQTWVLKVDMECQKCKKEVKKFLKSIDGVRNVHIDVAEQKVTVEGNVASDVLLKNLLASGRHAELWPLAASADKKQKVQESSKDGGDNEGDKGDDERSGGGGNERGGGGGGVASSVMRHCLGLLFLECPRRRSKSAHFSEPEDNAQLEEDKLFSDQLIMYKKKTLVDATNNFHDDNELGRGGFGPVYKGTTHDGKQIAVKKLSTNSEQGIADFQNEIKLLAKLQHRNLVKLRGCCADGSEKFIVYEYLPNKSLDKCLDDANKLKDLDWEKRRNIIIGVARGLVYLHRDSPARIVHRDIKPSNILLDEELIPKIADFGIAKLFPDDETHLSTKVAGTLGYVAPEYAVSFQLSWKADVFSFGVVLLELMTGRKNTPAEKLLQCVWNSHEQGNIQKTIDPAIIETSDTEQAVRFIHVGLLCTQIDPSTRPCMSEVEQMLSTDSVTLTNPTKPPFVTSVTKSFSAVLKSMLMDSASK